MRPPHHPPPLKGWEQPSTGDPKSPERRAVVRRAAARGGITRHARVVALAILTSLRCATALAAELPAVQRPVSPQESLQHLVVSDDLKLELVAHEPQVIDPVAIRFDEEGRMWVVEMRDYPTGPAGGNPASSRISVLEDEDGDGFFETSVVFADDLQFATGVQPWQGGVFVTMAGKVAYMKDTDGDGCADQVETWFTGFAEQNTQLRANDPRLALDNRIYVANGLRGGMIVDARRPDSKPLSISGMDFCFDPHTGECEAVSGAGQFGMTFDDYGNRFICSNRNPAIHVVLENRHLQKNPLVAVPAVTQDVAQPGEKSRIFPITRSWTTSNLHAGQFTAACGVEIYRGNALPAAYRGNVFTCEPTGHLVHREVMAPAGVSFASKPAEDGREFLASRDPWFSPVNLEVGPDGALYVVDMYRAVIEHPEWMPTELQQRPDMLLGNDRGRIYRVVSKDAAERCRTYNLSRVANQELVAYLSHPNAWHRETAARLFLERQDKTIVSQLAELARGKGAALGRIHAIWLLKGLGALNNDQLLVDLANADDPRLLEQVIAAATDRADADEQLREQILRHVHHVDARVRLTALLAAAPHVDCAMPGADAWELQALLIAAGENGGTMLKRALEAGDDEIAVCINDPKSFIAAVARLAAASPHKTEHRIAIKRLIGSPTYGSVGAASFFSELSRRGTSFETFRDSVEASTRQGLGKLLNDAQSTAANPNKSETSRCEAITFAALAQRSQSLIEQLAIEDASSSVRIRAIEALASDSGAAVWQTLLSNIATETPAVQQSIVDGLLSREDGVMILLEAVSDGRVKPPLLDATRTARLLNYRDPQIRRRAAELLSAAIPADRQQVLADYQSALGLAGDPLYGREVFAKHCATCHKVGDVGVNFAPDISDSREKTPEQLLTDIIQPNRAVDANYFSYTALTVDGLAVTGILTAETATSITLREAADKESTLRRDEIEQLESSGVSFMPEGLEREIPHQHMADLIAFIKNWRYLDSQSPPVLK